MWNWLLSVFSNTQAWEQQDGNKTKETEEGKKSGASMERSKASTTMA